jgi:cytochrome c oxidase subunit 1
MKKGEKAEVNPWHATTLEWTVPSPPPHDNFAGQASVVYRGPYEYAVPDTADDYVPQHLAPEQVAKAR